MGTSALRGTLLIVGLLMAATACTSVRPRPTATPGVPGEPPATAKPAPPAPKPGGHQPDLFESPDFIVTIAKPGDTPESLAARHLGDPRKKWMIEDYMGTRTFSAGQEVVIPRRQWNPVGVFPWGYQLVPVLVYHNISAEARGKLSIAARNFEAQMRLLHAEGFQTVSLADFMEFTAGRRQLPRRSVLLTFDDGYRSFMQYARPVLKDLGFTATLFVYSDFVGGGPNALSWQDLRTLVAQGFDVQAHSKTHGNLRRKEGESQEAYVKRIEAELAFPIALFQKHLGRAGEVLAYPYGDADDELLPHVAKHGYVGAFTVRRQSNPSFVFPLKISRSQIYAEMTSTDFFRNLTAFQDEDAGATAASSGRLAGSGSTAPLVVPVSTPAASAPSDRSRDRLAALHNVRSEYLEQRGRLRQALEERTIALTIDPRDRKAQAARKGLEKRIAHEVTGALQEGRALLERGLLGEAQQRFLTVLSLDPTNRAAFEALQNEVREVTFIAHTVRPGDTCPSLAELYYGDRLRCEVIAETNRLALNARLRPGQKLKIPEIPGVPFQLR